MENTDKNNTEKNGNGGNGATINSYALTQIAGLIKTVSGLDKDVELQFQQLTKSIEKIEKIVNGNSEITSKNTSNIEKLYTALNQVVVGMKNLKTAISMRTKDLQTQINGMVKKPKWKKLYTWLIGIIGFITLILTNIEHIKNFIEMIKGK